VTVPTHAQLFGNPERSHPRLCPDGSLVAYLAPHEGSMNLWLAPVDELDSARPLTTVGGGGLRPTHSWSADGSRLLLSLDDNGDEQFRLYALTVADGDLTPLTPAGTHARLVGISAATPATVLIAANLADPARHDYFHVDLDTAELSLVCEGNGHLSTFGDRHLQPGAAMRLDEAGAAVLEVRDGPGWTPLVTLGAEDSLGLYLMPQPGLVGAGSHLELLVADGADTVGLVRLPLDGSGRQRLLGDPGFDVEAAFTDPATRETLAVAVAGPRRRWLARTAELQAEIDAIAGQVEGELFELDSSLDGSRWLMTVVSPSGPTSWLVWDRASRTLVPLFQDRPELSACALGQMEPFTCSSRDGLTLHGYLTYPVGRARTDLPTVLYVHGGPWQRDSWSWNPLRQLFATRGYLCVQVNFRGSTGYGRTFLDAGDREWAGRMHDDLLDTVAALADRGIVDPKRVTIFGGSYGGFAALVGAAFTPDDFVAAIAWCPPTNLVTTIRSFPPYWAAGLALWKRRVGDPDTEPEFLYARSPMSRAGQIRIPLLLVAGANDPRCPASEAEQIVKELDARAIPHTCVVVADEGHGFLRQENNIKLLGWIEDFLATHMPAS
jgi:dipeptidyl aminopeptidase/acylaminoacyl peptidase